MFIRSRSPGPVSPRSRGDPVAAPVVVAQQVRHLVHPHPGQLLHRGPVHERRRDVAAPVPVDGHRRHPPRLHGVQGEQRRRQVGPDPGGVQPGGEELVEVQCPRCGRGHRRGLRGGGGATCRPVRPPGQGDRPGEPLDRRRDVPVLAAQRGEGRSPGRPPGPGRRSPAPGPAAPTRRPSGTAPGARGPRPPHRRARPGAGPPARAGRHAAGSASSVSGSGRSIRSRLASSSSPGPSPTVPRDQQGQHLPGGAGRGGEGDQAAASSPSCAATARAAPAGLVAAAAGARASGRAVRKPADRAAGEGHGLRQPLRRRAGAGSPAARSRRGRVPRPRGRGSTADGRTGWPAAGSAPSRRRPRTADWRRPRSVRRAAVAARRSAVPARAGAARPGRPAARWTARRGTAARGRARTSRTAQSGGAIGTPCTAGSSPTTGSPEKSDGSCTLAITVVSGRSRAVGELGQGRGLADARLAPQQHGQVGGHGQGQRLQLGVGARFGAGVAQQGSSSSATSSWEAGAGQAWVDHLLG